MSLKSKRTGAYLALLLTVLTSGIQAKEATERTKTAVYDERIVAKIDSLREQSEYEKKSLYQQSFSQAYKAYPNIPYGLLESLSYTSTHWKHRLPSQSQEHLAMPQGYGLFGFYNTERHGFFDILKEVADFNDLTVTELLIDERRYILATANYISHQLELNKSSNNSIESNTKVIAKLSGIVDKSLVSEYAIDSFVYQVLLARHQGFKLSGIEFQGMPVEFSKAFTRKQLNQLRAPKVILETVEDRVLPISKKKKKSSKDASLFSGNNADVDYPGAIWVPAANYSSRNGTAIDHVVIHTMQGSYAGSIVYFQDSATQASAHYMIRSSDGQITQMVREFDKAWHVRSANPYTVGIEHEGFVDDRSWYTEAMYTESAKLTQSICLSHQIDCSKVYDGVSHAGVVLLSQDYTVKGHQHYPDQTHTDPGINWDWPYYHDLVNGVVAPNRFPQAVFSFQCTKLACELDANASNDPDGNLVDYQWDFGDSVTATGTKVNHQYSKAGSFSATLTVVDNIGASNSLTKTITVSNPSPAVPPKKSGGGGLLILIPLIAISSAARKSSRNIC